jgi:hypothetical protein
MSEKRYNNPNIKENRGFKSLIKPLNFDNFSKPKSEISHIRLKKPKAYKSFESVQFLFNRDTSKSTMIIDVYNRIYSPLADATTATKPPRSEHSRDEALKNFKNFNAYKMAISKDNPPVTNVSKAQSFQYSSAYRATGSTKQNSNVSFSTNYGLMQRTLSSNTINVDKSAYSTMQTNEIKSVSIKLENFELARPSGRLSKRNSFSLSNKLNCANDSMKNEPNDENIFAIDSGSDLSSMSLNDLQIEADLDSDNSDEDVEDLNKADKKKQEHSARLKDVQNLSYKHARPATEQVLNLILQRLPGLYWNCLVFWFFTNTYLLNYFTF